MPYLNCNDESSCDSTIYINIFPRKPSPNLLSQLFNLNIGETLNLSGQPRRSIVINEERAKLNKKTITHQKLNWLYANYLLVHINYYHKYLMQNLILIIDFCLTKSQT